IREYVLGVLVMPPLIACIWMGVFGGAGLHYDLTADAGLGMAVQENITSALFRLFDLLPLSFFLSVMGMALIFIFLITSADSASYIVAQMTDRGSLDPPLVKRLLWGVLIAAICLTLMATGGLEGLQAGAIVAALPFTLIIYAMVWSLLRELAIDRQLTLRQLYREHDETPVAATIEEARNLNS
ncbi:MAG TPA: BCCT family transporter, partial [Paracoccaceae bacterium]|nr:BCCT family transporter [Paracoccaceae bacterium]